MYFLFAQLKYRHRLKITIKIADKINFMAAPEPAWRPLSLIKQNWTLKNYEILLFVASATCFQVVKISKIRLDISPRAAEKRLFPQIGNKTVSDFHSFRNLAFWKIRAGDAFSELCSPLKLASFVVEGAADGFLAFEERSIVACKLAGAASAFHHSIFRILIKFWAVFPVCPIDLRFCDAQKSCLWNLKKKVYFKKLIIKKPSSLLFNN